MSANSAVTVLRSPSGSASAAVLAGKSAAGLSAFSAAPHAPQNLKRGGLSLPQLGQSWRRSDPQLPQNLASAGLSYAQLGQSISARLFPKAPRYLISGKPGWGYGARGAMRGASFRAHRRSFRIQ